MLNFPTSCEKIFSLKKEKKTSLNTFYTESEKNVWFFWNPKTLKYFTRLEKN